MSGNRAPIVPLTGVMDFDEDDRKVDEYAAKAGIPQLPTAKRAAKPAPAPAPAPAAKIASLAKPETKRKRGFNLSLEMPDYVMKDLKRQAFEQECSVRYLLLKALNDSEMVSVKQDDLIGDRRRR